MIEEAMNQVRLAEQAADETVKAAKNKADALKKENAEKIKQLVASEAEKDAANRAELLKKRKKTARFNLQRLQKQRFKRQKTCRRRQKVRSRKQSKQFWQNYFRKGGK